MSLTGHLDDPESAVRRHFEVTYPHIKEVRCAATSAPASSITIDGRSHSLVTLARFNPGQPKVLPGAEQAEEGRFDWGAAGTAFDYRVRVLLAPQDPTGFVAAAGAEISRDAGASRHQEPRGPNWLKRSPTSRPNRAVTASAVRTLRPRRSPGCVGC